MRLDPGCFEAAVLLAETHAVELADHYGARMSAQRVRDEAVEVLRFLSRPPAPEGATDYQLNRHILGTHGPAAVTELRRELTELGLIEATTDAQGWQRWRLTAEGDRLARCGGP